MTKPKAQPNAKQLSHQARVRLRGMGTITTDDHDEAELAAVLRAEVLRHHEPRRQLGRLTGRPLRRRVAFLQRYRAEPHAKASETRTLNTASLRGKSATVIFDEPLGSDARTDNEVE